MSKRIFLSPPHMSGKEQEYINNVFESNYITSLGEYVDRFELKVKDYTKTQNALAVINGTSAIHLALRVLGIKEGDNVLASTFTFIGSISAILYQKANPIFIDSNENWNINPQMIEDAIKKYKPKAIVLTHLYGQMAEMTEIMSICRKFGVYVIEDVAESLGATLNKKQSGTFGDFGVFSFNGNKILTTSGGGMLISENKKWIEKAKFLSTQAKENKLWYEHKTYGYNYRMSNVLAAIGVAQMEVLQKRVDKKRQIFEWYKEFLTCNIEFMPEIPNSKGNRWLTTFLLKNKNTMNVIKALDDKGIESRPLWKPMHLQELFKGADNLVDGTSEKFFNTGMCVASGTTLEKKDIKMIAQIINNA